MSATLTGYAYLIAGVCFIMALRGLSSPESARQGNMYGVIGMAIAVITTLLNPTVVGYEGILIGVLIGGAIGTVVARRIQMTALPQLVAAFHSLVGMAAVFVAAAGLFQGGIAGSANALMAQAAPPDKYGSAFGAAQSAIALALGMGPLLGGVLAVSLGLRSVFPAGAVLLVITAIAGAVFLRGQRAPEAAP